MRAAVVKAFADVATLAEGELPDPLPGPGEVLVRVEAVAANYVDILVVEGRYQFLPEPPFAPGKLPVGTVVALGAGVTAPAVGTRVQTMAEEGGYAELALAPAESCVPLPDTLSAADAAAMSLAFDTAYFALVDRGRIAPGETVLVLGATGSVGHAAVQLAKAMGARVIAGVSSMAKAEAARALGADAVVDLSMADLRDGLRAAVHAETDGRGADVVLDPLGGDVFDAAIRAIAWRGRLVVIGFAAGRIPTVKANYLLVKNIEVTGLQVSDYRKRDLPKMRAAFADIFRLHAEGKVRPMPVRTLPLSEAGAALAAVRDRKADARLVLLPNG